MIVGHFSYIPLPSMRVFLVRSSFNLDPPVFSYSVQSSLPVNANSNVSWLNFEFQNIS